MRPMNRPYQRFLVSLIFCVVIVLGAASAGGDGGAPYNPWENCRVANVESDKITLTDVQSHKRGWAPHVVLLVKDKTAFRPPTGNQKPLLVFLVNEKTSFRIPNGKGGFRTDINSANFHTQIRVQDKLTIHFQRSARKANPAGHAGESYPTVTVMKLGK
jgi:hypothetical protein